ncbi:MAG TPA: iron-sulfur cluster repair di-iron protein [Thermoanaerobaculia bacterium]|nr:iron-sulfur cluster repair di-iron protein [Thermoanaerobaculia bacterium]
MNITPETRVAEIATQNPATIRVFQRFGIDFCCGGKRPVGEVCAEKHMTFGELRIALESAAEPATVEIPGADAPLTELVRFIVGKYHADLRQELPRLSQMAAKVLDAHGAKHPDVLPALAAVFRGLREELESHMLKEERVLFPYVERLEALAADGQQLPVSPFGSIQAPIGMMEHEHETAAEALRRLRELTGGYNPPAGACNTFRGLYHGLGELEKALHEHIHLENNVVFPRAARLEEELSYRAVT